RGYKAREKQRRTVLGWNDELDFGGASWRRRHRLVDRHQPVALTRKRPGLFVGRQIRDRPASRKLCAIGGCRDETKTVEAIIGIIALSLKLPQRLGNILRYASQRIFEASSRIEANRAASPHNGRLPVS